MDCSEWLPLAVAGLVAGLAALAWGRGRGIADTWLRRAVRIVAGGIVVGALLYAASVAVIAIGYTRRLPAVVSPDGRHVALTAYTVNDGSGADVAEVSVRRAWVPYSYRVYTGPAHYQAGAVTPEPQAVWTDATHLTVRFHRYPDMTGAEQGCASAVDGIAIRCEETQVVPVR
jgi:hypothetical protein